MDETELDEGIGSVCWLDGLICDKALKYAPLDKPRLRSEAFCKNEGTMRV